MGVVLQLHASPVVALASHVGCEGQRVADGHSLLRCAHSADALEKGRGSGSAFPLAGLYDIFSK